MERRRLGDLEWRGVEAKPVVYPAVGTISQAGVRGV